MRLTISGRGRKSFMTIRDELNLIAAMFAVSRSGEEACKLFADALAATPGASLYDLDENKFLVGGSHGKNQ